MATSRNYFLFAHVAAPTDKKSHESQPEVFIKKNSCESFSFFVMGIRSSFHTLVREL